MCGIFGIVYRNGNPSEKDLYEIRSALKTLTKRGPDLTSYLVSNNVILGHTRLAIIDLSPAGNQPMSNEDGSVSIVFNGEAYNYLALKKRLTGKHKFKGNSDTEVLLHLYEEKGTKLCKNIEGMAAFGIYDKNINSIVLARDRFGKKPLYYYLDTNFFCFASEIKALRKIKAIRNKLTLDQQSLHKFLFYGYIPHSSTIFDEIHKVPAATVVRFDITKWQLGKPYKYWDLSEFAVNRCLESRSVVLDKVDGLLRSSVEKRLMSDVPLGIFLSGGVDSSLISYYMKQLGADFSSFSVSYKNSPEADETEYINYVCEKVGFETHTCEFADSDVPKLFTEIYDYIDEYFADAAIIPLYFISKIASQKIKVVLSGDGGDEIFGGYTKYTAQKYIDYANRLKISWLVSHLAGLFKKDNPLYKLKVLDLPLYIRQFIFGSGSFMPEEYVQLMREGTFSLEQIFQEARDFYQKSEMFTPLNKCLYLDASIQLPDFYLVKGDQATMAASLEMRNPFLDKQLSEYAFTLPDKLKIHGNITKYLTKMLAERYFSHDFAHRKKRGFGVPLDKWIRGPLKPIFKEYLFVENPLFSRDYIKILFDKHVSSEEDNRFKLLRIFSANYCYNKYHET